MGFSTSLPAGGASVSTIDLAEGGRLGVAIVLFDGEILPRIVDESVQDAGATNVLSSALGPAR